MKAIYKYTYSDDLLTLHGIFVAEDQEVTELIESGRVVNFGVIGGRECMGPVTHSEFEQVTTAPLIVSVFENSNLSHGYDPVWMDKNNGK